MARKVFVSILGAGPYSECMYSVDEQPVMKSRYIQLATFKYILAEGERGGNKWTDSDKAYIFMTDKAESDQWLTGKTRSGNVIQNKEGLKELSECENYQFEPVKIENGENEIQIWSIFQVIYGILCDNDELYFDITHAFRYQPMLLLALINYSKFLKNITVKSISYGNFMAEGDLKPIMNLTSISVLQDWTFAAGHYLRSGNVEQLIDLCNDKIRPILKETKGTDEVATNIRQLVKYLKDVVEERQSCRGMDIVKSTSLKKLKQTLEKTDTTFIEPFSPIIEKIKDSLVLFDENENVKNGFSAAVWCYKNGLFQQSATILQESIVSFFCLRHNIRIDDETNRDIVNKAFNIKSNNLSEDEWEIKDDKKEKLKVVLRDELLDRTTIINCFNNLTTVRNDINHSGMRSRRSPMPPSKIKENIKKCINLISSELFGESLTIY